MSEGAAAELVAAVVTVTAEVPESVAEELARAAEQLEGGTRARRLEDAMSQHPARSAATRLAAAWGLVPQVSGRELAGMLRAAAARGLADASNRVEVVMTGPSTAEVPTRSTEVVVGRLVEHARRELLLVTYTAWPYPPLLAALTAAVGRGVKVQLVVETVEGAQGYLREEPAQAFASIPGLLLFHWPPAQRPGPPRGRLHAKVAVADRDLAFVTSANLTGSALAANLECGLLVRGGSAPQRIRDHFAALQRAGVLVPLVP